MDGDVLTGVLLENSWSIIIGFVVVAVMCVLAWFFSPKGENQTYVQPPLSFPAIHCRSSRDTLRLNSAPV